MPLRRPLEEGEMEFEPVICFEVHAELNTRSKLFCACPNAIAQGPNKHICPVCTGQPGVLPVLNKRAVELCIKTGLALNCKINPKARFARKNYFYPDLPKGYQISQYEEPLCEDGTLMVHLRDQELIPVGIKRVHLEEDAGKLVYPSKGIEEAPYTLVDFNRAGVPLIEIVSDHQRDPITSLELAKAYLENIRQLLRYIGVSHCQMELGQMRADVNISLRPKGSKGFGNRVEIKNMSSFRFILEAISYEMKRQEELLRQGQEILQETRLFDEARKITIPMRSKEDAPDYRYFPEPDLVPLDLSERDIQRIREEIPELPWSKAQRFMDQYGLSREEAMVITKEKGVSDYFEACALKFMDKRRLYTWITKELFRIVPREEITPEGCAFPPEFMVDLISLLESKRLTEGLAREVMERSLGGSLSPSKIVELEGIEIMDEKEGLMEVVKKVLVQNPEAVQKVKMGQVNTLNFSVGQVTKETKGKADPKVIRDLLMKEI